MKAILELFAFMKQRRKFILWPVIIVLILLGVVLVFAANSAVAPFIYTLF